jgi:tetratricopeptide (TPR) repeat protein
MTLACTRTPELKVHARLIQACALLCGTLWLFAASLTVLAAPHTLQETETRISHAIDDLGHADHLKREAATQTLWDLADEAEPAIRRAAASDDPEISVRANALLKKLSDGVRPNTSDATQALIRRFKTASSIKKTQTIRQIFTTTDAGPKTAHRLIASEPSAAIRKHLARTLYPAVHAQLSRSMFSDDQALINTCLRLGLFTGEEGLIRNFVAYHAINETLPLAIRQLEAEEDSPYKWHALALALRADKKPKRALVAARRSETPALTRLLMEESQDWNTLLQAQTKEPKPGDVEWLGYRAAYARLAADTNQAMLAIGQLESHATMKPDDVWFVTEALLINDQPERAIEAVLDAKLYDVAARLLYQRRAFKRLLALADEHIKNDNVTEDTQVLADLANRIRKGDKRLRHLPAEVLAADQRKEKKVTTLARADEALKAGRVQDAIARYREATTELPGYPLPPYLEGLVRQQAAKDDADAQTLIHRATLAPLAHEAHRARLAYGLAMRNHEQATKQQWQLLWKHAAPNSPYRIDIAPRIAEWKVESHADYTAALRDLEVSQLQLLHTKTSTSDVTYCVAIRALMARYRILDAISKNDIPTAAKHIREAQRLLPFDIECVIDVYSAVKGTANTALGQTFFDETLTGLHTLCDTYPQLAEIHNEAAWLAARCRQKLDIALTLAKRAVALAPDSPEYLDTLAEIYFQMQQREKAISLIQRCIELNDDFPYFSRQLKRFQTGNPSSDPEE